MIEFLCQPIAVPLWAIILAVITGGGVIIIPNLDNDW